jgi:DNA-binding transcriptional MerR regulator
MYLSKAPSSFASLLTIPRVGFSTAGFWKCSWQRHFSREGQFSGFSPWSSTPPWHGPNGYRKWSPEEDAKILELHQQGLKTADIRRQMHDRNHMSVSLRLRALECGATGDLGHWTTQEDAILSEMRQKGMSHAEISKCLPGRSWAAVKNRVSYLVYPKGGKKRPYTAEDIQRIIDMRIKDYKGSVEIAKELNRSRASIEQFWKVTCSKLLTKEEAESLRLRDRWSENEVKRLWELHSRYMTRGDMALQFPSKSYDAVSSMMGRMGIKAKARKARGKLGSHDSNGAMVRS